MISITRAAHTVLPSSKTLSHLGRNAAVRRSPRTLLAPPCTSTFSTATAAEQHFPSLLISSHGKVSAQGSFAQTQAQFLDPDESAVQAVVEALRESNMGIVAHYYMDVELQGVLQKVAEQLPGRIGIADSLKMGDLAVDMVERCNCNGIVCLGVDFMSESVQAILSRNGHDKIPVYRATAQAIGCSLAESAERDSYRAWLQKEGADGNALHVVYINTSLETKAVSSHMVPTITCTSSNVLKTMLQASAQMPGVKILYGPDTYMGENLQTLLHVLLQDPSWTDERIATDLHPQHNQVSLQQLHDSIHVYPSGNCIVHHMFGASVVDMVRQHYLVDCFVTAHLEVPGEMFQIAMEQSLLDRGVVGSTSDILHFVERKVKEASDSGACHHGTRLRFILGTEAGMVTSIVQSVHDILDKASNPAIEVEIIFPVAQEAVMGTGEDDLAVVPGVAGGEGCSTAGGCATCPFMKMNSLDSLMQVLEQAQDATGTKQLEGHLPPNRLQGKRIDGVLATDLGSEPILHMRSFMQSDQLPHELVKRIVQEVA